MSILVSNYSPASNYLVSFAMYLFALSFGVNKTSTFQEFPNLIYLQSIIFPILCQNGYSTSSEETRQDPLLLFIILLTLPEAVRRDGFFHSGKDMDCHLFCLSFTNDSSLSSFFMISKSLSSHQIFVQNTFSRLQGHGLQDRELLCCNCNLPCLCIYIYLIYRVHGARNNKFSLFSIFYTKILYCHITAEYKI